MKTSKASGNPFVYLVLCGLHFFTAPFIDFRSGDSSGFIGAAPNSEIRIPNLLVHGAVSSAGSVVCTLEILCAECVPASGTEDLFFGNIVKTYGDTKH